MFLLLGMSLNWPISDHVKEFTANIPTLNISQQDGTGLQSAWWLMDTMTLKWMSGGMAACSLRWWQNIRFLMAPVNLIKFTELIKFLVRHLRSCWPSSKAKLPTWSQMIGTFNRRKESGWKNCFLMLQKNWSIFCTNCSTMTQQSALLHNKPFSTSTLHSSRRQLHQNSVLRFSAYPHHFLKTNHRRTTIHHKNIRWRRTSAKRKSSRNRTLKLSSRSKPTLFRPFIN